MKKITGHIEGRSRKILGLAVLIILSSYLIFSYFHEDIKDAKALGLKAAKALEGTKSYRFDISSNLSMLNEDIQVMKVEGEVDSVKNKLHLLMRSADSSMEAIVIGDRTFAREEEGPWLVRNLDEAGIWKDKLIEQRSILENVENAKMYTENGSWILEIVPEKEEMMEQMREAGLETSGIKLGKYVMRYWIEPGDYHVRKAETLGDIEMNFRGMNMSVRLVNIIYLSNYNEKFIIEAPV